MARPKGYKPSDTKSRQSIIDKLLAENSDVIEPYERGFQIRGTNRHRDYDSTTWALRDLMRFFRSIKRSRPLRSDEDMNTLNRLMVHCNKLKHRGNLEFIKDSEIGEDNMDVDNNAQDDDEQRYIEISSDEDAEPDDANPNAGEQYPPPDDMRVTRGRAQPDIDMDEPRPDMQMVPANRSLLPVVAPGGQMVPVDPSLPPILARQMAEEPPTAIVPVPGAYERALTNARNNNGVVGPVGANWNPQVGGNHQAVLLAQQNNTVNRNTLNQQNIQNNLTQNNLTQNTLNQQNIQNNIQNIIQTYPGIEGALTTLFQGIEATFLNVSERNNALIQALNGLEMELKAEGGNTAALAAQLVEQQLQRFSNLQAMQSSEMSAEIMDNKARINKVGLITEALADGQSSMQATLDRVPEQLSTLPGRVIDALNQSVNNPINKLSGILEQAQSTVEAVSGNGDSKGGSGDGGPGLQEQKMMNDTLKQIASALNPAPRMPWDDTPRTVDNYFATVPRFRKNPRAPATIPQKVGARVINPKGPRVYYVPQGFAGVQDK